MARSGWPPNRGRPQLNRHERRAPQRHWPRRGECHLDIGLEDAGVSLHGEAVHLDLEGVRRPRGASLRGWRVDVVGAVPGDDPPVGQRVGDGFQPLLDLEGGRYLPAEFAEPDEETAAGEDLWLVAETSAASVAKGVRMTHIQTTTRYRCCRRARTSVSGVFTRGASTASANHATFADWAFRAETTGGITVKPEQA